MNAMKSSMEPVAWYNVTKLTMQLPNSAVQFLLEIFTDKMTWGFSNVPGPKKPFVVAGSKSSSMGFAMPVGKSIPGSLGIISHGECVKAMIMADRSCTDPRILRDYFEETLDEILGGREWREWKCGIVKEK